MKIIALCLLLATAATAAPSGKPMFKRGLNKIVGGSDASPGEFPYQISFQDTSYITPSHFCGGSVYSEEWMITNAHCVLGQNADDPSNLQIVAGDNNLFVDDGTEQTIKVIRIIQHEDYDSWDNSNDIALLQIETPLVFDDYTSAVILPAPFEEFTGDAVVTGWGALTEGGGSPDVLQSVDVPVVTDDECREAYGDSAILDSMICAGEAGKDACQGDGGGPMVCESGGGTEGGIIVLCGIVSWGYGCARPEYPGVYTQVSYFVDWIKTNAQ